MDSAIVWFIIGLALILAELAVPGVILVFLGIAAWVVAAIDWMGVDSLAIQLWVFGIISAGLVFFARRYVKSWFSGKERTAEGDIDEEFVGKVVTVLESINAGDLGKVELKGAHWTATSGESIEAGAKAEVIARDNITLTVKPR